MDEVCFREWTFERSKFRPCVGFSDPRASPGFIQEETHPSHLEAVSFAILTSEVELREECSHSVLEVVLALNLDLKLDLKLELKLELKLKLQMQEEKQVLTPGVLVL